MKKHLLMIAGATLLGQALLFAPAFAATSTGYNAADNTNVSVNAPLVALPLPSTGTMLFNAQEGAYSTTGADVPHDYVWLTVNGTPLLAVDPPSPMFSGEWCKD